MDLEAFGDGEVGGADLGQCSGANGRHLGIVDAAVRLLRHGPFKIRHSLCVLGDNRDGGGLRRVCFGEDALQAFLIVTQQLGCFLFRDVAAANQGLGVEATHGALSLNEVVHQRLRHRGVITLIMTATAVADQVNDNVLTETLLELVRQLGCANNSFWIVPVDMEDGSLNHLGDVGGVHR